MKKVIPIIGIVAMTIPITPSLYASCNTFSSGCSTTANGHLAVQLRLPHVTVSQKTETDQVAM